MDSLQFYIILIKVVLTCCSPPENDVLNACSQHCVTRRMLGSVQKPFSNVCFIVFTQFLVKSWVTTTMYASKYGKYVMSLFYLVFSAHLSLCRALTVPRDRTSVCNKSRRNFGHSLKHRCVGINVSHVGLSRIAIGYTSTYWRMFACDAGCNGRMLANCHSTVHGVLPMPNDTLTCPLRLLMVSRAIPDAVAATAGFASKGTA